MNPILDSVISGVTEAAKAAPQAISEAAKAAPKNIAAMRKANRATIDSLAQLDEHIFLLDYKNDYCLDRLLEKGIKNTAELLKFCAENIFFSRKVFKAQDSDFGCTTFNAFNAAGEHLMGRNFDYKDAPTLAVWTHPAKGYASIGMVDCNFMLYGAKYSKPTTPVNNARLLLAPYCCVDGINEKGLAIAVVELKTAPTDQNTYKIDLTTTTMIRTVLDTCATVDEAVKCFESYDLHDAFLCSYHYQITDASGKSVVLEYVNNEMRLFEPKALSEGAPATQCLANFFLAEDGDNAKGFGNDRYEKAEKKLTECGGVMEADDAMTLLEDVHLNYHHEKYPWQVTTLWSAVYNCNALTVDLAAGLDYSRVYRISLAEPCIAERVR